MKPSAGTFGGTHAAQGREPERARNGLAGLVWPLLAMTGAVVAATGLAVLAFRIHATWPDHPPVPPYYKTFTGRLGE